MSVEDERSFKPSNKCWISNKFFAAGDNMVRDHDHVNGKYRGSAHWNWNINLKLTKNVPAIFYNLRGYDSHLMVEEIGKFDLKTNIIQYGFKKYMAFTINKNLVFIDSMQYMNSSLGTLVKNLSDNDFKFWSQEFIGGFPKLVKPKDVHPYEYMDSFKTFFNDKLSGKGECFSSLKDESITERYYLHAIDVWIMLKKKTMDDYHDLYLKSDVLLLADVFEKVISMRLEYYRLFVEKWRRGGIPYIAKRYSKVNNKHMKSYDDNKPIRQFLWFENGSMSSLPCFKMFNKKEIDQFDVNLIAENSLNGYILEVDLEYPDESHELHNDYPLAPEQKWS